MTNFKDWTKRGVMAANDLDVMEAVVKKDPSGIGRIAVTGEVHLSNIEWQRVAALQELNDLLDEPLFITTKNKAVRMIRFEPEKVWRCIEPNLFASLVQEEEKRLGVGVVILDEFDFYYSMIETLRQKITKVDEQRAYIACPIVENLKSVEDFYQFMYLTSLILFNKPGYMAVPITEHFVMPETVEYMKSVKFRHLNEYEADQYKHICKAAENRDGITNEELDFLAGLFDSYSNR